MRHGIPLPARLHVEADDLVVGRQGGNVLLDEFPVDPGGLSAGCDISAGIEPVLMKYLRLEAAEDGLDALGRRLMGSRGAGDHGDLREPLAGIRPLGASLVIVDQFVGKMAGELDGVTVSLVHDLETFGVADMTAQEDLAGGIDDLEDIERRDPVAAVDVGFVEEVQTGAVTVPKGVPDGRHDGLVHARVGHLRGDIAQDGSHPLGLHLRPVEIADQGGLCLERFPAFLDADLIVALKQLRIRVDRSPGTLQRDDQAAAFLGDLAGIPVDQAPADKAGVAVTLELADLVAQPRLVPRERMPVLVAQALAARHDRRPVQRGRVPALVAGGDLQVRHLQETLQDRRIQRVLFNLVALQAGAVGELITLVVAAGVRIQP